MLGHNQTMLVAALDTTTRVGSLALVRDGVLLATHVGDDTLPHATRLPGDMLRMLAGQNLAVSDVDVFGVATGPGSFTGLRIGLAAVQGLAFATNKLVVGVSAFEALAAAVWSEYPDAASAPLAIWLDGQRQEVFAAVLTMADKPDRAAEPAFEYIEGPSVAVPSAVLLRWTAEDWWQHATLAGDGTREYRNLLTPSLMHSQRLVVPTPLLAPAIGWLAGLRATSGRGQSPHAVKPVYVRRPDAELARDRQRTRDV